MIRTILYVTTAIALLGSAPVSLAADDDGRPGHKFMQRFERMERMMMGQGGGNGGERGQPRRFAIIDANDDGHISADEAAAQRESVFAAMDSDDDGELTEEEYMTVRMGGGEGRNEERMKARQEQKRARFAPMDTDKSGKVSQAEFMAEGKARYEAADSDKDGMVTPWEFRSQHQG